MKRPLLPMAGACRCGRVRLRITALPLLTMACHCRGCQRMSSSAFSLSAAIPTEAFEITAGTPVIGGLHDATRHYFCGHCMTWMYTHPESLDMFVNLRPTMLDDIGWFAPYVETYTSTRLPWATTPAKHSFAEFPPFDAYEALVREFASQWSDG